MKKLLPFTILFFIISCQIEEDQNQVSQPDYNNFNNQDLIHNAPNARRAAGKINGKAINAALTDNGSNYQLAMGEFLVAPGFDKIGITIYFSDIGNKKLIVDFVPFDPRRADWSGPVDGPTDDITYSIDQVDAATPNGLEGSATTDAIDRAMQTWEGVTCSYLPVSKNPDFGLDLGIVAYLEGLGGGEYVVADIMHAGWGDISFGGGIIGVTFTFIWVDEEGNPTDINNDGKIDCAFREIYYDPSWVWAIDDNIDVETVALHESGHGLSQAHFGTLFSTDRNGKFHFSPRALMNAGYTGVQQSLSPTDLAGHCSIWANWPN